MTEPSSSARERLDATVPVHCDECPRSLGTLSETPVCDQQDNPWCLQGIVERVTNRAR